MVYAINDLFGLLKDDALSEEVYPFVIDVVERIWHEKMIEEDVKVSASYFIILHTYNY